MKNINDRVLGDFVMKKIMLLGLILGSSLAFATANAKEITVVNYILKNNALIIKVDFTFELKHRNRMITETIYIPYPRTDQRSISVPYYKLSFVELCKITISRDIGNGIWKDEKTFKKGTKYKTYKTGKEIDICKELIKEKGKKRIAIDFDPNKGGRGLYFYHMW